MERSKLRFNLTGRRTKAPETLTFFVHNLHIFRTVRFVLINTIQTNS